MPSPIAHLAAGYTIYRLTCSRQPQIRTEKIGPLPTSFIVAGGFSLMPDADSLAGLIMGNFGRFHNNLTHSYVVGFGAALLFATWMRWRNGRGFVYWFTVALLGYYSHVFMDSLTVSRGVMALWPFTAERFLLPVRLFYGFHWSDGLLSVRHIWTVLSELVFAAVLIGLGRLLHLKKWLSPRISS